MDYIILHYQEKNLLTMITYKRTFDAIKYLASKECVIPYDPVSNFYNINLRIDEELGQCINEMTFEHHFYHDKSVLISFIGKRGSKIFWKTPELDYICHIDIEADRNGTINLFCQKYLMQGISGIKYGKNIFNHIFDPTFFNIS